VQRFCRKLMDQAGDMRVVETSGPVFMMLGHRDGMHLACIIQ